MTEVSAPQINSDLSVCYWNANVGSRRAVTAGRRLVFSVTARRDPTLCASGMHPKSTSSCFALRAPHATNKYDGANGTINRNLLFFLQAVQGFEKFFGQVARNGESFIRSGMDECELPCVQALRRKTQFRLFDAVDGIACDRMPDVRHVDSDLMRSACFQAATQMCILPESLDDLPMGHGFTAVFHRHRHAFAVGRMATDGRINCALIFLKTATHDALISAAERVILELIG